MKNRQLTQQQIRAYAHHLQMEEKSGATMEKYLRDIRAFACWLDGRDISKELTSEWKSHLVSQDYAPTTVNAMLSALNSLLEFLDLRECRVKFLKIQRRLFRDANRELTKDDYQRLLNTAHKLGKERLGLLVETIGATGILLPGKLRRKLLKYAKKQKTASGAIFRTKSGKGLGRRQIWAELKGLCKHAGVEPGKVFPHNLRHLFATVFYRTCRDIAKLADLLGHSSIETTRIYLVTSGTEHQQIMLAAYVFALKIWKMPCLSCPRLI